MQQQNCGVYGDHESGERSAAEASLMSPMSQPCWSLHSFNSAAAAPQVDPNFIGLCPSSSYAATSLMYNSTSTTSTRSLVNYHLDHQLYDYYDPLVPLQFAYQLYEGPSQSAPISSISHRHLGRLLSETLSQPVSAPSFELGKMTAQEIMDAKALAASKSHSEAERRRRERINNHLAKLRSLLPSTTKTDKASLLAEVIQHVKELKHQTSLIAETSPVPTEMDELTVDSSDEDGKFVIKVSLCCEDRSDLLSDLTKTLKTLRLRTLKAEIITLGGRVKNVLFITGEEDYSSSNSIEEEKQQFCISSIQEALKAVMEKNGGDEPSGGVKRQRTSININQYH